MRKITLLLVDDHLLFRDGVAGLLRQRPEFEVIGSTDNGADAIRLARELLPDVILMDVRMPGVDGLEATLKIKAEMPTTQIIMLTMSGEEQDLFEAIKNGAQGYLLKNTSADELYRSIQAVYLGEAPMSGSMAIKILAELRRSGKEKSAAGPGDELLTNRETEVLNQVAQGKTNADIANVLGVSENTIKKQLSNILAKLHLQNRVQAALYARQKTAKPSL
jgi:DNA-binding NarL/FixJ family response regulator